MAIQVTSEERLRFKKRARQRLLGAVVLLLAAAIILPLLLDQAPRPLSANVVINMAEPVMAAPASVVLPASATVSSKAVPPASAQASQPPPGKPAHAQLAAAPLQLTQAIQVAQRKPAVTKADVQKIPAVAEKSRSNQGAATARPAASVIDKSTSVVAPKSAHKMNDSHSRYVVQLGAFSNTENVRQLRERLKRVGVDTYIENLHSGSMRVRAGPFDSRVQADKTLAKIAMAGIQAQIVPLSH